MTTCYVIDDEKFSINEITGMVEKTPGLKLIGSSVDPILGLQEILENQTPDIIFLDVEMPNISGLELMQMMPGNVMVILTTAHAKYAVDAFDKDVVDYLFKPFNYSRFIKAVEKAKLMMGLRRPNSVQRNDEIFVNTGKKGNFSRIRISEIVCIKAIDDVVSIHTSCGVHFSHIRLKEIEQSLPPEIFIRIHRAFIISVNYVKEINGSKVTMLDNSSFPLGDLYKNDFLARIEKKIVKTYRGH
ncbi:two-component system LytT family response regulator [Pedobacter africanus]|uniref:DNA-binding LytR/AlgR family response regulator n=1 Tax=Pedobacter africanus TaxID=151894 RepID=A0ACC6KZ03_9SPHI|nr:LytTR family DNA-binding domain-containing protein [Pedobacter africanus]MDR6784489.1 DNA-binding LytR/AlgR family response regulator [Pedobacter africanus]